MLPELIESSKKAELWDNPNKFARKARLEVGNITIHGYQEFSLSPQGISPLEIDAALKRKHELASDFINCDFLAGKSMLDIGANGGFFSFLACLVGASSVVSLDMDDEYLDMIRRGQEYFGWKQIRPVNCRVQDWNEPADLVTAFAMIHWLYSCTASYGSLDAVIGKLASLSRSVLLVEWVAPNDPAIQFFNHTEWDSKISKEGYTLEAFEAAMRKHFVKFQIVGEVNPTRILYVGYHYRNEITIRPELPLIAPVESVISSRCLTSMDGVKYFSRVYLDGVPDRLIKQATGDLALHEAKMLSLLSGSFPKVFSSEQREGFSVLIMERIAGGTLAEAAIELFSTPKRLAVFMLECLALVRDLQKVGMRHRDIRIDNIMVRDGHPVLIDFGWAELEGAPYLNPLGLGGVEAVPNGPQCDIYSLSMVFHRIIPRGTELFNPLLTVMRNLSVPVGERLSESERILKTFEFPANWEVPLVLPVACRRRPQPPTPPEQTPETVLVSQPPAVQVPQIAPVPPARAPWLPRTLRRWRTSIAKRLPLAVTAFIAFGNGHEFFPAIQ